MPTYHTMITNAIKSLNNKKGSSRQSIVKYILSNNNMTKINRTYLNKAIKAGVESGHFIQIKQSFKLHKEAKKTVKKNTFTALDLYRPEIKCSLRDYPEIVTMIQPISLKLTKICKEFGVKFFQVPVRQDNNGIYWIDYAWDVVRIKHGVGVDMAEDHFIIDIIKISIEGTTPNVHELQHSLSDTINRLKLMKRFQQHFFTSWDLTDKDTITIMPK